MLRYLLLRASPYFAVITFFIPTTQGGNSVFVTDDAVPENDVTRIRNQLINENYWLSSVHQDLDNIVGPQQYVGYKTNGVYINSTIRENVNSKVLDTARSAYGELVSHGIQILSVHAYAVERTDFSSPSAACQDQDVVFKGILVVSQDSHGNDYGEIVIYEGDSLIINQSLPSRAGRLILVPCSYYYRITPPSIAVMKPVIFLAYDFTSNHELNAAGLIPGISESKELTSQVSLNAFILDRISSEPLDKGLIYPRTRPKGQFKLSSGNYVIFFDDVIPMSLLQLLLQYANEQVVYQAKHIKSDDSLLVWLPFITEKDIASSIYWKCISQLLSSLENSIALYPYGIKMISRKVTNDDIFHKDSERKDMGYSIIIDLSTMTDSSFGETVFQEDKEVVGAIKSKFGRVILYPGYILYSARSTGIFGTGTIHKLLIKCAPTQAQAWQKMLSNKETLPLVIQQVKALSGVKESDKAKLLDVLDIKDEEDWATEIFEFVALAKELIK